MPGGEPPFAAFGWGPVLDDDQEWPLGHGEPPRRGRVGVVFGLLVICSVVVLGLVVVVTRGNDASSSVPAPSGVSAILMQ